MRKSVGVPYGNPASGTLAGIGYDSIDGRSQRIANSAPPKRRCLTADQTRRISMRSRRPGSDRASGAPAARIDQRRLLFPLQSAGPRRANDQLSAPDASDGSGKPQIDGGSGYAGSGSSLKIPRGLPCSGGTSWLRPNGALVPPTNSSCRSDRRTKPAHLGQSAPVARQSAGLDIAFRAWHPAAWPGRALHLQPARCWRPCSADNANLLRDWRAATDPDRPRTLKDVVGSP